MATTARAKWEKYFAGHDTVRTTIRPKAGKPIYFYPEVDGGIRLGQPRSLHDGMAIEVNPGDSYSSRYRVTLDDQTVGYVSEQFVNKPKTDQPGPSERLRIHSETLTSGGTAGKLDIGGHRIDVQCFTRSDDLYGSIIDGLKVNPRVSDSIVGQFEDLFASNDQSNFTWKEEISVSERNELGKYVGELIPGGLALSGDWSSFEGQFTTFKPTRYGVPSDPSFSGIDSYLANSKSACLISSKFGPGARASVFSNILPEAIRRYDSLSGRELRILVDCASSASITAETLESKRGSKEVLYTYGLNEILGMKIKSPMAVFQNLRSHVMEGTSLSSEAYDVLNEVAARAEPMIRDKLPGSITQFFSRTAAARLNGDPRALDDMKTVLALKDFIQLNLNMKQWRAGEVNFKVSRSADSEIKIVGNKGIIGDIDSRQGMLNYYLT